MLAHINKEVDQSCGSGRDVVGAIAVAIGSDRPQAQVVAIDASKEALELASRNIGRLHN